MNRNISNQISQEDARSLLGFIRELGFYGLPDEDVEEETGLADGALSEEDVMRMTANNPELLTLLECFMQNRAKLQGKSTKNDIFAQKRNLTEYATVQKLIYPTKDSSPESSMESEINFLNDDISRLDRMIEIKEKQVELNQNFFVQKQAKLSAKSSVVEFETERMKGQIEKHLV